MSIWFFFPEDKSLLLELLGQKYNVLIKPGLRSHLNCHFLHFAKLMMAIGLTGVTVIRNIHLRLQNIVLHLMEIGYNGCSLSLQLHMGFSHTYLQNTLLLLCNIISADLTDAHPCFEFAFVNSLFLIQIDNQWKKKKFLDICVKIW